MMDKQSFIVFVKQHRISYSNLLIKRFDLSEQTLDKFVEETKEIVYLDNKKYVKYEPNS